MLYVYGNEQGASVVYDISGLTQEEKEKAVQVENLPIEEVVIGKISVLKLNTTNNTLYYDYINIPIPQVIVPPKVIAPEPTNKDVLDGQMILMDVMATMYEAMLAKGTV